MTIFRQPSTRGILSSTGWFLLTVVLLFSAGTPNAQAQQPNQFAENLTRVEAILNWASGTYQFISGIRTAQNGGVTYENGCQGASSTVGDPGPRASLWTTSQ